MMNMNNHPFHLVDYSPWAFKMMFALTYLVISFVQMLHCGEGRNLYTSMVIVLYLSYLWWKDVCREATLQGLHTLKSEYNLKLGMILFIVSEVMFFLSFFWGYIYYSVSVNVELGLLWPPKMIFMFNPYYIPLMNTLILVSSGVSVTLSHYFMVIKSHSLMIFFMLVTITLGFYFTFIQALEYHEAGYAISDSTFGSIFFTSTGFHGAHVIIGSIFLTIVLMRMISSHFSASHHLGLEMSSWYWHFVDVVWLFLYVLMYWWPF